MTITKAKTKKEFKCEICGETRAFHRSHNNPKQCIACYWHTPPRHTKINEYREALFKS